MKLQKKLVSVNAACEVGAAGYAPKAHSLVHERRVANCCVGLKVVLWVILILPAK
jgi:hypothetical protein